MHAMVHVASSEDKLPEMFLSFRLAAPGDWTQAAGLRGKQLCSPSCFTGAYGGTLMQRLAEASSLFTLSFRRTRAWLLVVLSLSPETFLLLLKTVCQPVWRIQPRTACYLSPLWDQMSSKKQLQKGRVVWPYNLEDCSPSQWESQGGRRNLDHGASWKAENASVFSFYPVLAPAHGMVLTTFRVFPSSSVPLWKQPQDTSF